MSLRFAVSSFRGFHAGYWYPGLRFKAFGVIRGFRDWGFAGVCGLGFQIVIHGCQERGVLSTASKMQSPCKETRCSMHHVMNVTCMDTSVRVLPGTVET